MKERHDQELITLIQGIQERQDDVAFQIAQTLSGDGWRAFEEDAANCLYYVKAADDKYGNTVSMSETVPRFGRSFHHAYEKKFPVDAMGWAVANVHNVLEFVFKLTQEEQGQPLAGRYR